jgi:DNA-binding transcriptional ArsR family regulator
MARKPRLDALARKLEALGDPTRLAVFRTLVRAGDEGLPVGAVQARTGVPASTLSHHLHRLIAVGLVTQERRGTTLICRADYAAMREIVDGLVAECCADARRPKETAA